MPSFTFHQRHSTRKCFYIEGVNHITWITLKKTVVRKWCILHGGLICLSLFVLYRYIVYMAHCKSWVKHYCTCWTLSGFPSCVIAHNSTSYTAVSKLHGRYYFIYYLADYFVFIRHQLRQMKCQKCFLFCFNCCLSFMIIYGTLVILFSIAKYYLPKPANWRSDNHCT